MPVPDSQEWKVCCEVWDIQSPWDLREIVRPTFFDRGALDRALPALARKINSLSRAARLLALKKATVGDPKARFFPPNDLDSIAKVLVPLIHRDYSRLSTWYVQRLLAQVHQWSIDGDEQQRVRARSLAEQLGKALALGTGRGRPPIPVSTAECKKALREVSEKLKPPLWVSTVEDRDEAFRIRLAKEFPDVPLTQRLREAGIPPLRFLRTYEATPLSVGCHIAAYRMHLKLSTFLRRVGLK